MNRWSLVRSDWDPRNSSTIEPPAWIRRIASAKREATEKMSICERETVATVELFTRTNGGRFVPALSLADQKPHKQGDKYVKG